MAQFVLDDADVNVGGNDYSDHVKSVTVTLAKEDIDDTAMADSARSHLAGLEVHSISVEFQQDFSASIDAEIWAAFNAGTALTVIVKATSSAAGATNPSYTVSCKMLEYTPIDGTVGDEATFTQVFMGNGTVSRGV